MSYYGWAPYVPVSERRAKAKKQLEKMKKKGLKVQPVELAGRKIAASFWGKGWCDHMESFSDYANRLPRGRTYVRNGSICHLEIRSGEIKAIVSGTTLYNVAITINPLKKMKWDAVRLACSGRIGSLIDLLRGKLESGVMSVVADRKEGLFPLPGEMKFTCDCPDWAGMCKHVAAVLYGVGARLDHSPEMLFFLRGVNHEELVDVTAAVADTTKAGTSRRRLAATGIADVFGIDLAESGGTNPEMTVAHCDKKTKPEMLVPPVENKRDKLSAARQPQGKVIPLKAKKPEKMFAKAPLPEPLTGNAIFSWRASRGETQAEFASRIGITAASVSQWEKKGAAAIGVQRRTFARLRRAWEGK